MNRRTSSRTFTGALDDSPWIRETRRVESPRGVVRGRHGGRFYGLARLCTVRFIASMSGVRSMTMMEEDRNRASVEGEEVASTEMNDL